MRKKMLYMAQVLIELRQIRLNYGLLIQTQIKSQHMI